MAPLSSRHLEELVLSILGLVYSEGGFATKTKLLKLLYLADIESYRDAREFLTGFDWIFHLYGPWTPEYDSLLAEMQTQGLIAVEVGKHSDLEAQFIKPKRSANLDKLPLPVSSWAAVRRFTRLWANEPTGEILNYVYFHTEPMRNAARGERLDFSTVAPREAAPLYKRSKSSADKKQVRTARRQFLEAHVRLRNPVQAFTPPNYDDTFFLAVAALDEEPE